MRKYMTVDGELYHYGVKGMKWGVRNDRKRDSATKKIRTIKPNGKISKKEAKRRSDFLLRAVKGRQFVKNKKRFMNLSVQQANQFAMEQATRASINASLQAASLGMSGGMHPFMFGMM